MKQLYAGLPRVAAVAAQRVTAALGGGAYSHVSAYYRPTSLRLNSNLGPLPGPPFMPGCFGTGVVSTLSIMPYSIACFGSIHLLRDSSRMTCAQDYVCWARVYFQQRGSQRQQRQR